jgi:hypothetical protein
MSDEYKILTNITLHRTIKSSPFFIQEEIEDVMNNYLDELECTYQGPYNKNAWDCEGKANLTSGPPHPRMDRGLFDEMSSDIKSELEQRFGIREVHIKSCFINLDQCDFTREV